MADAPDDLEGIINAQVTELDIADRATAELSAALARAQAHIATLERDYDNVWKSHCTIQTKQDAPPPAAGGETDERAAAGTEHALAGAAHPLAEANAGTAHRRDVRTLEREIAVLLQMRNGVADLAAGEECLGVRVLSEPDKEHVRALRASKRVLRAQIDALEDALQAARVRTSRQRAEHDEAAAAMGLVRASMETHNARLAEASARQQDEAHATLAAAQHSAAEAAAAEAAVEATAHRLSLLQTAAEDAGSALRACEARREHVERDHAQQLEELERVKLETRRAAEARRALQHNVARLQGVLTTIHAKYAEFCRMQLAQHDAEPAPAGACRTCSAANDYIQQSFMLVEDIVDKLGESLEHKRLELHAIMQDSSLEAWQDAQLERRELVPVSH